MAVVWKLGPGQLFVDGPFPVVRVGDEPGVVNVRPLHGGHGSGSDSGSGSCGGVWGAGHGG